MLSAANAEPGAESTGCRRGLHGRRSRRSRLDCRKKGRKTFVTGFGGAGHTYHKQEALFATACSRRHHGCDAGMAVSCMVSPTTAATCEAGHERDRARAG